MVKGLGTPILPKYLSRPKIEKTAMPSITKRIEPYVNPGFSPYGMTGLDLWLDGNDRNTMFSASNGGSIVTSGQIVYRWEDKSGNNNHVYPILGVNYQVGPQYSANVSNGLGLVTFSNTIMSNQRQAPYPLDVYMVLSHCNYNYSGGQGICNRNENIFSVKYPEASSSGGSGSSGGGGYGGGGYGSNSGKDFNSLAYGLSNTSYNINNLQKWCNNSANYARTCNVVPTEQETSMGFILINWGISNSDYYIKRYTRTLAETNTYTSWTTYANSNTSFRYFIGGLDITTYSNNFIGSICEILSFSNLLNYSNRTQVEVYLANKWGLQANIPLTHPGHLQNTPITVGYSLATSDGVHGYSKLVTGQLVRVVAPDSPVANTPTISNLGAVLYLSWGDTGLGGIADYYNLSISNSTDNTTYTLVKTINYNKGNSYTYSMTLDNKYYKYGIQAINAGGSNSAVSGYIVNSVPGNTTLSTPTRYGNDLQLAWTPASRALTYAIRLFYSSNSSSYNLIYQTVITTTTLIVAGSSTSIGSFTPGQYFKYTIVVFNGSGQNPALGSQPFSSAVYQYTNIGS
jgi:hypothetical protein